MKANTSQFEKGVDDATPPIEFPDIWTLPPIISKQTNKQTIRKQIHFLPNADVLTKY